MPNRNEDEKAVGKVLGEPAFAEFTENTWRIRANLITASVIAITVALADLHIDSGSSFLGLKFSGLNDTVVRNGLFWIEAYLLIHFLWAAFDNLLEWRLRVTGTKVAFVTTGVIASEHGDYPGDPRKSTLYNWWKDHADRIGNMSETIKSIEEQLKALEEELKNKYKDEPQAMNVINACLPQIGNTHSRLVDLERSVTNVKTVIESARIPASLGRFDRWFEFCLRSQNLRWLLVEFSFPLVLGGTAIWLLYH